MLDALSVSQAGMLDDIQRMHAISHNLANASTAGYKRELVVSRPFAQHMSVASANGDSAPAQLNVIRPQLEMLTDHRAGTLKFTGNPMDVALQDESFFSVKGEAGLLYTRQGNFRLDAQGRLVTVTGLPVLGQGGGEIRLTSLEPVIDKNGNIFEGDEAVAQLQVVKFADPSRLTGLGNGLYSAGEGMNSEPLASTQVRQGYLEMPNVVLTDEMIRMIETMRHFESSQRVLKSYDSMLDKSINVIGEF